MVDIQPHTVLDETFETGRPWLAWVERKANRSITLDLTAFGAEHKDDTGNIVLSGVALAETAEGLYAPAAAPAEGTETVIAGHLFTARRVNPGSTRTTGALMTHGGVIASEVPGGVPEGATRPAQIDYR